MTNKFNCPACTAPMEYDGKTTLFQTCSSCGAPIVVPSDVVDANRGATADEVEFSETPVNTPVTEVVVQPLDTAATPLDDPLLIANAKIFEATNAGNKVQAIKTYSETHGVDLSTAKAAIEALEGEIDRMVRKGALPTDQNAVKVPDDASLAKVANELRAGRKIEAIKIFRETFNTGLKNAKEAVEALERGEQINPGDFLA